MAENRWGKRFREKMLAQFANGKKTGTGFVEDLSVNGLFLRTPTYFPKDTQLTIEMTTDFGPIRITGAVRWANESSGNLAWEVQNAGMGIRILRFEEGEIQYEQLIQQLCRDQARNRPLP